MKLYSYQMKRQEGKILAAFSLYIYIYIYIYIYSVERFLVWFLCLMTYAIT